MKTPEAEPNNETFLCERCGDEKTGDSHCVDNEITVCAECYADIENSIQESIASLYKDEV
jgi:ribosome-binding protein aMBF1 (putative translation factor)